MCDFTTATADNLDKFLVGDSVAMRKLRAEIIAASRWDFPVIVEGDSGTGKDLVANLVFALWVARKETKGKIIPIDCGTLTGDLLLSRLFGHKKGSFTGALADYKGVFLQAENGALFFDELANLRHEAQTLFLRVLESLRFTPLGGKEEKFTGRFIAATNQALKPMVAKKTFREDLYYRMTRIVIRTPNLREHLQDLPAIANAYLLQLKPKIKEATGKEEVSFSMEVLSSMMRYNWPGNVRELYSVIDRALVSLPEGAHIIEEEHLHFDGEVQDILTEESPFDGCVTINDFEIAILKNALRLCNGNQAAAAKRLGIGRSSIGRKMKRLGIRA